MKIKTRLYITSALVIIIVVGVGLAVFFSMQRTNDLWKKSELAHEIQTGVFQLNSLTSEYFLFPSKRASDQWIEKYSDVGGQINEAATVFKGAEERTIAGQMPEDFKNIGSTFDQLLAIHVEGDEKESMVTSELEKRLVSQLTIKSQALVSSASSLHEESQSQLLGAQAASNWLSAFLVVLMAAIVVVASITTTRAVVKPLAQLQEGAEVIGSGDLDYRVDIKANDETGQLARAFNEMASKLKDSRQSLEAEIAQRKRSEQRIERYAEQLEASNKELEAFSYSVSHDLRAPLRAIQGFSNILVEEHQDKLDEEGKRLLGVITGNTQQMGRLIDDLLGYSRLGRQELKLADVNMEELASAVIKEQEYASPGRSMEFKVDSLPPARCDRQMIQRVLANLLSNAVKFTRYEETALIEVGFSIEECETVYYVKDNGVGFDMRYENKLFSFFQRLHSEGEFEGTGVGLASVKRIVEKHGGRVWGEGEVGNGATFYFSVPTR